MDLHLDKKLAIFYHVLQSVGWEQLFLQQINALCVSGLYDKIKLIYVCVNGFEPIPIELSKMIVHRNKNFDIEADTLYHMWKFAKQNENYKILYIHTKGITYDCTPQRKNEEAWRLYLEYFNIYKWQQCVKLLEDYDCVGTEWTEKKSIFYRNSGMEAIDIQNKKNYLYFFAGNFWWANAKYISSLDPNYLYDVKRDFNRIGVDINSVKGYSPVLDRKLLRFNSETWIGTNNPKYYNFLKLKENPFEFYHNCTFFPNEFINFNKEYELNECYQ